MLTVSEASGILKNMYDNAPEDEQKAYIHLFGIKYASQIEGLSVAKIVRGAELPESYVTEVNAGKKLARYVDIKEGML